MLSYIVRRVLLMVPTLIGITFIVFMLMALAPGGIGAGLRAAGGQMENTSAALQEAYLNDRYGLDRPAVAQYVQWLHRISPVKLGRREFYDPAGERVYWPSQIDEPTRWDEFADDLPRAAVPESVGLGPDSTAEERQSVWVRAQQRAATRRGGYIEDRVAFEEAIENYERVNGPYEASATGGEGGVTAEMVREAAGEMLASYQEAIDAREAYVAVLEAGALDRAGLPIIEGVLSVGRPDTGKSWSRKRPVDQMIAEALPRTMMLNLLALPIIYLIAIPGGMLAAVRRGGLFDTASGTGFIALWSFPIPLAGVLCIGYLANKEFIDPPPFPVAGLHSAGSEEMPFLPRLVEGEWERGWLLDMLWHVVLPVSCLVYGGFAVLAKQTRAAMLDNFNQDYVRTARAKGVSGVDVIFRHVFRNSLLPLITLFVTIFPVMISGSVVIERIFSIQGMGNLLLDAIVQKDREVILAMTLMIAGINVVALLLADVLYALADPRISYK